MSNIIFRGHSKSSNFPFSGKNKPHITYAVTGGYIIKINGVTGGTALEPV